MGDADWRRALQQRLEQNQRDAAALAASAAAARGGAQHGAGDGDAAGAGGAAAVRVISFENTQAHALTCSKHRGSLGHHFKVLDTGKVDTHTPPMQVRASDFL